MTTAGQGEAVKDFYETLGVSRSASDAEIKKAYRRLARKYHPDVSKERDSERRFKEMKEAYEVLRDPEKRAAYDRFGHDWRHAAELNAGARRRSRSPFGGTHFDGAEPFGDVFDQIFGSGGHAGFGRRYATRRRDGEHLRAALRITLEEAYRGGTRQVTVDVPSQDASGRNVTSKRTLNVRIPKGVVPGQKIRLADQGSAGTGVGSAPGDLYLEVDILPHRHFRLEGRDVHIDVPVAPWEAALGATISVPTLGGNVDLKIPAGSSSGKTLRLKGRGLPGSPAGDQYVRLKIVVPEKTPDGARTHYEALRRMHSFEPRKHLRRPD